MTDLYPGQYAVMVQPPGAGIDRVGAGGVTVQ